MPVRRLVPSDAAAFHSLRLQALRDSPASFSFSSSYEEECETPLSVIAGHLAPESGRNMFGAFWESELVGMVGIGREGARKLNHKGFVRGMYVTPAFRGKRFGRLLLKQALEFSSTMQGLCQVTLSVTAGNTAAIALDKSFGFKSFGEEPGAMLVDGVLYDEVQMVRHAEAT
jgi:RimJ/RimL family protein N-acetyltransferase